VVEDEPKTGDYLRQGLTESGFVVDIARDGIEGLHLARTLDYEAIILDVMLPGQDGWTVLRELRREKQTPVLFLTARDRVEDRVQGLERGADDYLVKPFAFSELLARLRTIMRRGPHQEPEVLRVADLELDPVRRRVHRGGRRIRGEVVSRTLIAEQVWDMNFDSDTNVVEVVVRRLRAKVDEPFGRKLIHTIRGVGYVLEERD
jgi:two-component system copper resistance phosphate regulon response regulator CusR